MSEKTFMNLASMSDKAVTEYIGAFIKHQRMEQNKTQAALSAEAGISRSTLSLLERGETVTLATLIQVLRVLDQLAVLRTFEVHESFSPLALAKLRKEKRKRASSKTKNDEANKASDW